MKKPKNVVHTMYVPIAEAIKWVTVKATLRDELADEAVKSARDAVSIPRDTRPEVIVGREGDLFRMEVLWPESKER